MKKKLIFVGIIIVVILVILGITQLNKKTPQAPATTNVSGSSSSSTIEAQASFSGSSSSSVSLVISKTYSGKSFLFNYPTSWNVISISPFSIDNFNGNYQKSGAIPAGGAQVYIATTTSYGPVQNIVDTELMGATNITSSTVVVDKVTCQKYIDEATYAGGATSKDISIYCSKGNALWKIYLSYPNNDPAEGTDLSDFNGMLASMKLLP